MFKNNLFSKKKIYSSIYAFTPGRLIPLSEVKDEVFASHTLGKGVAIVPSGDVLYAPCDGQIDNVTDTLHALNMTSDSGAEILLHIGIDTVNLKGKFFTAHVKKGQKIKKGDKLISFQREKIEYEKYDSTVCMAICNSDAFKVFDIEKINENVTTDDIVIKLGQ